MSESSTCFLILTQMELYNTKVTLYRDREIGNLFNANIKLHVVCFIYIYVLFWVLKIPTTKPCVKMFDV